MTDRFMPDAPEIFELYAVRYGHVAGRAPHENFLGPDPHESGEAMDFFVWAAVGPDHTYVIDCGYGENAARRRGRTFIQHPVEGLKKIGVAAATVSDLVITHLHYDHVGNFDHFPAARLHLQDKEMLYATGRHMAHQTLARPFEVDEVVALVREVYKGRVAFHDGDAALTPGFSLHHVGGHTMGLQFARVFTERGWVVVASDASHFYANMEQGLPFPIVYNVGDMVQGWEKLRRFAESADHVVPGHDPEVMRRYPVAGPGLEGLAVRLDVAPHPAESA